MVFHLLHKKPKAKAAKLRAQKKKARTNTLRAVQADFQDGHYPPSRAGWKEDTEVRDAFDGGEIV